jgi:hypothetical protein
MTLTQKINDNNEKNNTNKQAALHEVMRKSKKPPTSPWREKLKEKKEYITKISQNVKWLQIAVFKKKFLGVKDNVELCTEAVLTVKTSKNYAFEVPT